MQNITNYTVIFIGALKQYKSWTDYLVKIHFLFFFSCQMVEERLYNVFRVCEKVMDCVLL
jgi:hypothetical protein